MSDKLIFRGFVLIFLVLGLSTRVAFHRQAGSLQIFAQEQRGGGVLSLAGLLTVSWLVGVVIFIIFPQWLYWSDLGLPVWLRWTGVALAIFIAPFSIWVYHHLAKGLRGQVFVDQDQSLVQDEPYQWIRHPMYTAYFIGYLSYFLMKANWFIGLTGLLSITLIMVFRVPEEEAPLIRKFGDTYRECILRTGKFLPRHNDRRDDSRLTYLSFTISARSRALSSSRATRPGG